MPSYDALTREAFGRGIAPPTQGPRAGSRGMHPVLPSRSIAMLLGSDSTVIELLPHVIVATAPVIVLTPQRKGSRDLRLDRGAALHRAADRPAEVRTRRRGISSSSPWSAGRHRASTFASSRLPLSNAARGRRSGRGFAWCSYVRRLISPRSQPRSRPCAGKLERWTSFR